MLYKLLVLAKIYEKEGNFTAADVVDNFMIKIAQNRFQNYKDYVRDDDDYLQDDRLDYEPDTTWPVENDIDENNNSDRFQDWQSQQWTEEDRAEDDYNDKSFSDWQSQQGMEGNESVNVNIYQLMKAIESGDLSVFPEYIQKKLQILINRDKKL